MLAPETPSLDTVAIELEGNAIRVEVFVAVHTPDAQYAAQAIARAVREEIHAPPPPS